MKSENDVRRCIDARLSGLEASEVRRMRIRAKIQSEKQEDLPVKRKLSLALVCAMIAAVALSGLAIGEMLDLFSLFGQRRNDDRYASASEDAAHITAEAVEISGATAVIDSAYYDGLSLNAAFRIENGEQYETFTPTEEMLADMQLEDIVLPVAEPDGPGHEILAEFGRAVTEKVPFGYRVTQIYAGDGAYANGVDIPPYAADCFYDESGFYCEMREFEFPLPEELDGCREIALSIPLYCMERIVWFDGTVCHTLTTRAEAGELSATVPLTEGRTAYLSGSGSIGGAQLHAQATLSTMAAVLTLSGDEAFSSFLEDAPEGIDPLDSWIEVVVMDEAGRIYRMQEFIDPASPNTRIPLLGTGFLPEELRVYLYTTWEGAEDPDLSELDCITLK